MTTSRTLLAGISIVALLGLTGCGGDDPSTEGKASQTTPSSEAPASSSAPSPEAAKATCKLKGKSGGTATLEQTADGLTMTFKGLPVPSSGTALYSVSPYDAAGEHGGQFGVKFQNGQQIAFFVFDFGSAQQTNIDGEADVSGDTVTATASDADLGPLSGVKVGSWSAAYNVNGNDVGVCPGGIDSLPFPG